jgi:hypothetical protein
MTSFFISSLLKFHNMEQNPQKQAMDLELKEALSIIELEERHEMTAAAADALRCGDNSMCTVNSGCGTTPKK